MRISKKMAAVLVIGMFTANTFAGVGIQAEVGGTQLSDLMATIFSTNAPEPIGTKIGIRVSGSDSPVAFDFLTGFGFLTETNDSASGSNNPKSLYFNATIGLSMKIHSGDKSALSILPRYSMTVASNSIDTGGFQSEFVYYSSLFNTLSLALEPSVKLSDNLELFTNFGIALKFIPASKYFDSSNKLTAAKDGATSLGFTGILLGFRYNL